MTYSHSMEEPGNLEVSFKGVQAAPKHPNPFICETLELEDSRRLHVSGQGVFASSVAVHY